LWIGFSSEKKAWNPARRVLPRQSRMGLAWICGLGKGFEGLKAQRIISRVTAQMWRKPMERAFRDWNYTAPKNVTYLTPFLIGAQHH